MKITKEILSGYNLTDKPVKHGGKWIYPSKWREVKVGELYWSGHYSKVILAPCVSATPLPVFTPCTLPPKPDAEWIKSNTPEGYTMTIADEPDLESVPFVEIDGSRSLMVGNNRGVLRSNFHGLRYGVTLTKKVEPVKRWVKALDANGNLRAIAAFVDEECIEICAKKNSFVVKSPRFTNYGLWKEEHDYGITESEYNALKAEWTRKKVDAKPETRSCNNCGNGPFASDPCATIECEHAYQASPIYLANWIPKAKPLTLADVPVGAIVKRTSGDEYMVLRRGRGGHLHVLGCTITDASEIVGWLWPQELKDGKAWRVK